MTAAGLRQPVAVETTRRESRESHITCCLGADPGHVALCGADVTDDPWVEVDYPSCVVCADLETTDYCPVRGRCSTDA